MTLVYKSLLCCMHSSAHFLRKSLKVSLALTEYNLMAEMEFLQQEEVKDTKLFFSVSP